MTDTLDKATADYWRATSHAQEHAAYVRMLRLGAPAGFGESPEEVERIKNCPDCTPASYGQPIEVEWLQFVPYGPVFAITRWPRMVMLVGFEEDRQ